MSKPESSHVEIFSSQHPVHGWYSRPCILGIDEAGRGPVLGPMVYAAAFCPRDADLSDREFADSKVLTEAKREQLLEKLEVDTQIGYRAESLSACFISGRMLARDRDSLNVIANDSTYRLIRSVLALGVNLTHAYIDIVGDAEKYKDRLSVLFPAIQFTVCPKADALYPIVSAASIVAKVTRDRLLRDYGCPEPHLATCKEFGCGYPGDAITKAWLEKSVHPVFGPPLLVRHSWATCGPVMEAAGCVAVRWECEAEPQDASQQTLKFGVKRKRAGPSTGPRHSFFRTRRLLRPALSEDAFIMAVDETDTAF